MFHKSWSEYWNKEDEEDYYEEDYWKRKDENNYEEDEE